MFILIFQEFYLYFYDLYRKTGDREDFEKIISDHANAAGNVSLHNIKMCIYKLVLLLRNNFLHVRAAARLNCDLCN